MLGRTDTFLLKSWFPSPTAPTWNPTFPVHVEEGRDVTIKNSSSLKHRHMEKNLSLSRMVQHAAEEAKQDLSASPTTYRGSTAQCKRPQSFVGTEWGKQEWMRRWCLEIRTCKDACRAGLLQHFTSGNTQTKYEIKQAVRAVFKNSDLPKVRSPQDLSHLALFLLRFSLTNLPLLPLLSLTKQIWEQLSLRSGVFWIS